MIRKTLAATVALILTTPGNTHHVEPHVVKHIIHVATVHHLVASQTMKAWHKVFLCETHNWRQQGFYGGGLGITLWNWQHHGGLRFSRTPGQATPEQQVYVARNIQHGLPVPDQKGACRDW
jgi:hypothetical protein